MRAVVLDAPGTPLEVRDLPDPEPGPHQVLLRVRACGVCRTDLHLIDGELPEPKRPVIPGHQIVGEVVACGAGADVAAGTRVGVTWLAASCGTCAYCAADAENLCDAPLFTGYTHDGGFAELALARADFCHTLPDALDDVQAAPLLCAGAIGWRTLRLAGEGAHRVGLYGFGAAAHLLAQVAVGQGREVYAFTRPGDGAAQELARSLGARWAGSSEEPPPEPLDAALIFAPVGALVPAALRAVRKGGAVVCGGIHMSDIPSFPYRDLWEERIIRSVANVTRRDARELLGVAARLGIRPEVTTYALDEASAALEDLRHGRFSGAAVLRVS